jgi:hypothetical protein
MDLALKEWAIAIEALSTGETVMLLRKGGIREARFGVDRPDFWLYPTYEHQKPELLKPDYADRVVPVVSGWHPTTVPIQAWATVTHEFELTKRSHLDALAPFHIWNDQFAEMRLKWKPRSPLTVLLLRVFRLEQPLEIAFDESYGGCRSWTTLLGKRSRSASVPAMTDEAYEAIVSKILLSRC